MVALIHLIRPRSVFLFKSNIMRAICGLSSLIGVPFLLRPCTFSKSLLLKVLLCISYIWDASQVCMTKAFIPLGYYLKGNLLRIFSGIHTSLSSLV